ncbi:helix-turn-helix domain-containing protein, partial [Enterobacter kobei]|uniref:helix-turn-helix domain-containing protein n=1 Tax=Enterobacter kobei TaxID=208224 RepID=UPI0013D0C3D5
TLEEIKAAKPRVDRAKVEATTEEDIRRHMIEDGEDPDTPLGEFVEEVPPAEVRKRLGMTQGAFAAMLGIPVGTLRNWEQG